ncbi:hypothetical protein O6H91_03G088300 [Diphasiastrum complanatum]|uniref:Uncharacterized protein n=1 Tax=Diphasiastrum complanatum TaxID=34168 RepID=A0ACC2E8H1_DIPCM|nr:hypothetical protein O6H91_03G088300 [Diphasiastrum complanatum]
MSSWVESTCKDVERAKDLEHCRCCMECLQQRGRALEAAIAVLSSEKLNQPCRDRLLKLVRGELKFVSKLTLQPHNSGFVSSTNFNHLEAVVRVLQFPLVNRACTLMQMLSAAPDKILNPPCHIIPEMERKGAVPHVDLVCYFKRKPAWVVVSARNSKHLSWFDEDEIKKGLRSRILVLLSAAYLNPVIRPSLVVLVFTRGVEDEIRKKLEEGFAAKRMDAYDHIEDASKVRLTRVLEKISSNTQPLYQGETLFEFEDEEWVIVQNQKNFASRELLGTSSEAGNNHQVKSQGCCPTAGEYIPLGNRSPLIMFEIEVDRCIEYFNLEGDTSLQHLHEPCRHQWSARCVVQGRHSDRLCERKGSQTDLGPGICGCSLSDYTLNQGYGGLPEYFSHLNLQEEEISILRNLELVNLDTTVLIGIISELSSGGACLYSEMSLRKMELRFGSLSNFVKEQALLELQKPFLLEIESILKKKRPIVSRYAWDEFWSIVSVIGGPHERQRAFDLSRALRHAIIPNSPSLRVMALPETKKIQEKHKIVFGTGDNLYASTLTSNVTFVRAAVQKGMAFAVINHRPLALTGD